MNRFRPDIIADTIFQIDPGALAARGVLWLAVDLDNTLTPPDSQLLTDEIRVWLASAKKAGLPVVLVSNNSKKRVEPFADRCGLPYVSSAMKPLGFGLSKAARLIGFPLHQGAFIGDQMFTDVYAARRAGMYAILVHPIIAESGGFFTFKRRLERLIHARHQKKGE